MTLVMTTKAFSFLVLFCLLLPCLFHAVSADIPTKPQFEFIKYLQGSKKGDKVQGIYELKKFLHRFGYLNPTQSSSLRANYDNDDDDLFDENIESAIKTYQLNFNLKPTGILDPKTVSKMMMPRCGVPDNVDGTTRMKSPIYQIKYAFFNGMPKWPLSRQVLYYAFEPGTRKDVMDPIANAFLAWSSVTPFGYFLIDDYDNADIKISFHSKKDGDELLDGPLGILGYAYVPTDGRLIYDADENWVDGAVKGAFDMGTLGLHELGHVLGLNHSTVEDAIMYPIIPIGATKGLHDDDIQGMRDLYA